MAKFTQDYAVPDGFGDTEFTARAGEEYLLTEYDDVFGKDRAEIAYLTPAGPYTATIEVASGSRAFPFTTDCAFGSAKHYYAVFADTIVYGDKALTNRLCELRAGTVLPRNTSGSSGYSLASEFSLTGPATYEVELNAFSAQCQGAESGYVSVPDTVIFGTHTWLVPITEILGPG